MTTVSVTALDDVADRVRPLLDERLPLPGHGRTAERWRRLTEVARQDVVVGRLLEAHADADAILAELTGERVQPGQWWGVWAAEPPQPVLEARESAGRWTLHGGKAWCSGAGLCTHALVTARIGPDLQEKALFAVPLTEGGVEVDLTVWKAAGMARSATGTVTFDGVAARRLGSSADYLERAGFWHGGAGVAACWLGGAFAVADALGRAAAKRPLDDHAAAHLGAVDAALTGALWAMTAAAGELDQDPDSLLPARIRALRVRSLVEAAAALTVDRVGRALGAGPLATDERHTTAVADVLVYVRQSHAERDLATLGRLTAETP